MKTILIEIPDNITVKDVSGEVSGHLILMLVNVSNDPQTNNRLLVDANATMLKVTVDGKPYAPPTTPPPNPVIYSTWHALKVMNLRQAPTTKSAIVGQASTNQNLQLSTEVVTQGNIGRFGLPPSTIVEAGYEWRAVENIGYIAAKIGTSATVKEGAYSTPTTPPPTSGSANLKSVNVGGKLRIAVKGTTRPVEAWVNMRSLAFCGLPRVNGTSQGDIVRHLDAAKSAGVRVIRFYTACVDLDDNQCADRVAYVLDEMAKRDLLGLLTLNDSLASGFHVKGDDQYRNYELGHLTYPFYHSRAYRGNDFNHARVVLTRVGKHPAIAAVDICNENGGYGRPDRAILPEDTAALRAYGQEKVALIRALCPQWVVWELISSAHVGCDNPTEADSFYRGLGLNALCVHLYREERDGWVNEQRAIADSNTARTLGLPIYIGELGVWYAGSNRKSEFSGAVSRYSWSAADSFWGFNGVSPQMNFSDQLGVSIHLPDYPDLLGLIRSYS